MNDEQRAAVLDQALSRQLDWISAAETRTNLLLTIETAMVAALFTVHLANTVYYGAGRVVSWLAQALLVAGLLCLAVASFPRTDGPKESVIFFRPISKLTSAAYAEIIRTLSFTQYLADLSAQVHRNAEIATIKFRWVKFSLVMLLVAIPFWIYAFGALVAARVLN